MCGYDANGNQTSRGNDTFSYDHENRLTQTVIGGATSSSVYNGDGLRLSHTVSGLTTNYVWDVLGGLPVVLQDGTSTYVYGLDLISATNGAGAQTYFLYDGLGSTTDLADGAGNSAGSYGYDVFGTIRAQTGGGSNYWLFTGEQRDGDTGLYFLRARYYDPSTGRFVGRDPIPGFLNRPASQNRYVYVENIPTNMVDPYGLFGLKEIGRKIGVGARFVANLPVTAPAYIWAEVNGGNCSMDGDLFIICSGMSGGYLSGGMTFGNVFLTGRDRSEITRALIEHEKKHATQWAIFGGVWFPSLYVGNLFAGWPLPGHWVCWNLFERWAGLEDGGYGNECSGRSSSSYFTTAFPRAGGPIYLRKE